MKKIFISLVFMLAVGLPAVLANEGSDSCEKVKQSFIKEFAGAQHVKWEDLGEYQAAIFALNGYVMRAYFDIEGQLLGSAKEILYTQLPRAIVRSVNQRFAGAYFFDVIEVFNTEGTSYRISVAAGTKTYRVKSFGNGDILEVVKIKK